MADEAKPERADTFAAKAKDLEALRSAVIDAANVGAGLWISYLFVLFYLLIAAGSVTHRDLFFENSIKLPFLNVELPLVGFFVLGPLLFLIVHAYVLLHFVLLADKVGAFHAELAAQVGDEDVRTRLRRPLPSNIFVQFLAGPREVRTGIMGVLLRLIAQISLVAAPLTLLVFMLFQFLPYHYEPIAWWQRLAVIADLALLWTLWPVIARGEMASMSWRDFRHGKVAATALASIALLILVFTVATFPGEWLDKNPLTVRFISSKNPQDQSYRLVSLHDFLLGGDVDFVARKPTSLWSNRLVLPGIEAPDKASFRGRRLEGALLIDAKLRGADFTGARLGGAALDRADLREAKFACAIGEADKASDAATHCADLQGATLISAQLQGATLAGARLRGATLRYAQLQGATLDRARLEGASLRFAKLYGASLERAWLRGANLELAELQGASLRGARLIGASLFRAQLHGAVFAAAQLEGSRLDGADLLGASLSSASLNAASLEQVYAWRTDPARPPGSDGARIVAPEVGPKHWGLDCPSRPCEWQASSFAALKQRILEGVPEGPRRDAALQQIGILDPAKPRDDEAAMAQGWADLAQKPRADFETSAIEILRAAGCDPDGAPYVAFTITWTLSYRFGSDNPGPAARLADAFLKSGCRGARGVDDDTKEQLMKLRDSIK